MSDNALIPDLPYREAAILTSHFRREAQEQAEAEQLFVLSALAIQQSLGRHIPSIANDGALLLKIHNDLKSIVNKAVFQTAEAAAAEMGYALPPGTPWSIAPETKAKIISAATDLYLAKMLNDLGAEAEGRHPDPEVQAEITRALSEEQKRAVFKNPV